MASLFFHICFHQKNIWLLQQHLWIQSGLLQKIRMKEHIEHTVTRWRSRCDILIMFSSVRLGQQCRQNRHESEQKEAAIFHKWASRTFQRRLWCRHSRQDILSKENNFNCLMQKKQKQVTTVNNYSRFMPTTEKALRHYAPVPYVNSTTIHALYLLVYCPLL